MPHKMPKRTKPTAYVVAWSMTMSGPEFVAVAFTERAALGAAVAHIRDFTRECPEFRHADRVMESTDAEVVEYFGLHAERMTAGSVMEV